MLDNGNDDGIIEDSGLSAFVSDQTHGEFPIKNNNLKMSSHNIKMVLGFVIVFVVAGLQALKGYSIPYGSSIDLAVSALLFVEHYVNGTS